MAIILLASFGQEVGAWLVQIPEQLMMEIQSRTINLGIQYGAIAVGQAVAGSRFVDLAAPVKLFEQGFESLTINYSFYTRRGSLSRYNCCCYSTSLRSIFGRSKCFASVRWIFATACTKYYSTRVSSYFFERFN